MGEVRQGGARWGSGRWGKVRLWGEVKWAVGVGQGGPVKGRAYDLSVRGLFQKCVVAYIDMSSHPSTVGHHPH